MGWGGRGWHQWRCGGCAWGYVGGRVGVMGVVGSLVGALAWGNGRGQSETRSRPLRPQLAERRKGVAAGGPAVPPSARRAAPDLREARRDTMWRHGSARRGHGETRRDALDARRADGLRNPSGRRRAQDGCEGKVALPDGWRTTGGMNRGAREGQRAAGGKRTTEHVASNARNVRAREKGEREMEASVARPMGRASGARQRPPPSRDKRGAERKSGAHRERLAPKSAAN